MQLSGDKLDLCDPFPLTMGCQIYTSGPSGTMQKYQGVCEFPHNVMHRRVFMAYFVLYHILIFGFIVNFVYIVLVLISPKCRSEQHVPEIMIFIGAYYIRDLMDHAL